MFLDSMTMSSEERILVRVNGKSLTRQYNTGTQNFIRCLLCQSNDQCILAKCWTGHCLERHSEFIFYRMEVVGIF